MSELPTPSENILSAADMKIPSGGLSTFTRKF